MLDLQVSEALAAIYFYLFGKRKKSPPCNQPIISNILPIIFKV